MQFNFTGEVFYWRGPSPHYFVFLPSAMSEEIKDRAPEISYGWGAIAATVKIGNTSWTTAIFPKDGKYLIPLKKSIRDSEEINVEDLVEVELNIDG